MANVRYLVNDVDTALDFYVGRLGFELVERWGPPFAMVRRGDLTLWLSGPGTSAARPMPDGAQPVPGGWNRLVLEVDKFDATIEALRAAGAHLQRHRRVGRTADPGRGSVRQSGRISNRRAIEKEFHDSRLAHRDLSRHRSRTARPVRRCWVWRPTSTSQHVDFAVSGFELGLIPDGKPSPDGAIAYWGVPMRPRNSRLQGLGASVREALHDIGEASRSPRWRILGNTFAIIENPHFSVAAGQTMNSCRTCRALRSSRNA
jgi:catechol 2,3-dioxygenase-like lactoylglutathione lyase family enzyme